MPPFSYEKSHTHIMQDPPQNARLELRPPEKSRPCKEHTDMEWDIAVSSPLNGPKTSNLCGKPWSSMNLTPTRWAGRRRLSHPLRNEIRLLWKISVLRGSWRKNRRKWSHISNTWFRHCWEWLAKNYKAAWTQQVFKSIPFPEWEWLSDF